MVIISVSLRESIFSAGIASISCVRNVYSKPLQSLYNLIVSSCFALSSAFSATVSLEVDGVKSPSYTGFIKCWDVGMVT